MQALPLDTLDKRSIPPLFLSLKFGESKTMSQRAPTSPKLTGAQTWASKAVPHVQATADSLHGFTLRSILSSTPNRYRQKKKKGYAGNHYVATNQGCIPHL